MRERIIIVGAGVMQGPAIRIAKELGFYTVAVDGSSAASSAAMADQFEQIDLKDKEGIEAFARSLRENGGLTGIMTAGTDFSATVAWVAEKLDLPGIPYESALNASDKARMRYCFQEAGVPSPEFIIITKGDTLKEPSLPFSLVIKPVDNMGGRGCRRVDAMEKFHEAAEDALRFSRSGRAIVESFMDGPEFSVDAIVYHGEITICGLADRHIFFPPYFIEMGHTMPTNIIATQQEALLETFCAGVRALGLAGKHSIGAAKGDIKLTPQGPMIGEIAARLSGGYMSGWTYPYSSGVEPVCAAILAAMGRKPEGLVPLKNWTSAERAFISIPGTVKAISGTESARGQPHVRDLFFRTAVGDKVGFPQNNVSKCGNVLSAAPDRRTAIEAAENAVRSILMRLDPNDGETAAFLAAAGESFPPDAFQLSAELRAALEKLPDSGEQGTGNREQGAGNREQGAGNREQGTGSREQGAGNREQGAGNREQRAGNREQGAGNREQGAGNREQKQNGVGPETAIVTSKSEGPPVPSPFSLLPLISFPALTGSGLRDYVGRSVTESLHVVRELTGLSLPEIPVESLKSSDNKSSFLGKSFWAALVRGGYQGAVYYIDQWRGEH